MDNMRKRSKLEGDSGSEDANGKEPENPVEPHKKDEQEQQLIAQDGMNESSHLLEKFPAEVWLMIFNSAKTPEVFEHSAKASPHFAQLVENRRVEYLFHKVLPIYMRWHQKRFPYRIDPEPLHQLLPPPYYELELSDDEEDGFKLVGQQLKILLNFREVCQFWNRAVIKYISEHPRHFKINRVARHALKFQNGDDPNLWFYNNNEDEAFDDDGESESCHLIYFKAKTPARIDKFLETFEHLPETENPFWHRKLIVTDPPRGNTAEARNLCRTLWVSIKKLLTKFGKHIWYCEIDLKNNLNRFSYYCQIREWLELMPNLKVLYWKFPIMWHDVEGEIVPLNMKGRVEEAVRKNEIAKLPHLEVFKADDLPYPMFREFVQRNNHIRKLQFHRKFPPPPDFLMWYDYGYVNTLENLTELSVVLWSKEEIQQLETDAVQSHSGWPHMKKLSIYLGEHNEQLPDLDYSIWGSFFNLITAKCKTDSLNALTLRLPPVVQEPHRMLDPYERSYQPWMLVGKVRILKLMLQDEMERLDFILSFKDTLEELQIILECKRPYLSQRELVDEKQRVQFIGYQDRMLESNIWVLCPKLRKLVVKRIFRFNCRRVHRYKRSELPARRN